jgi:16S rRNA C1402 N4-methylase RsmH
MVLDFILKWNFKNIRSTLSEVDEKLLISGDDEILMDLGMSSM